MSQVLKITEDLEGQKMNIPIFSNATNKPIAEYHCVYEFQFLALPFCNTLKKEGLYLNSFQKSWPDIKIEETMRVKTVKYHATKPKQTP